jgi:hypothetical protein
MRRTWDNNSDTALRVGMPQEQIILGNSWGHFYLVGEGGEGHKQLHVISGGGGGVQRLAQGARILLIWKPFEIDREIL